MKSRVKPIPDGYHSLTPYLTARGAAAAIEFYKRAFGAKEVFQMPGPNGKILHAEITIGDSRLMLADASDGSGPSSQKPTNRNQSIFLYVEDVDANRHLAIKT